MMEPFAAWFVTASAAIILVLGVVHLLYTFHGAKLWPRERELGIRMEQVSPVMTKETTMWKAWIGFNASHSYGAILFGAVYGYLSLVQPTLLFQSMFLLSVGLFLLGGYVFLAKRYWFSVPFRCIVVAAVLYVTALMLNWA
jgi:hypothetical protein